jgi:subtilisin-like proprotein convertase family protein
MRRFLPFFALLFLAAVVHAQDLRLDYERESLLGTYRHYTQYVDGLPVLGGEVIERVARDGSVRELHRAIAASAPKRALIPKSKAITNAPSGALQDVQLVAVNAGGEARPAWRVVVEEKPHQPVAHYIDAVTGALLAVKPLFAQITAKGRVFDTNPVTKLNDPSLRDHNDSAAAVPDAAYSLVDLLELNPSGMLAGPNVQIVDTDSPSTPHADPAQPLLFDRSQPQFEEVNVYFQIDRSQRYMQSLGYSGARRIVAYAVPVDPHAVSGVDNSLYVGSSITPGQGTLYFGDGGVDDAEDPDIVLHEFFHSVQDWIAPSSFFGTSSSQSRALGEGFSDYWAYSSNYEAGLGSGRDPYCLADWDARCAGDDSGQNCGYPVGEDCLRRVDSAKTMNDYNNSNLGGTEHINGEIWSSALREIFDALVRRNGVTVGRRTADTLVLESMFGAPSDPTYAIIARKLLEADRALNGGTHAATICSAFTARLILGDSDCKAVPRGDVTLFQAPRHGQPIPDGVLQIGPTLDIADTRLIERLSVTVNIDHPSRGDLSIVLIAPDGTRVILQNLSDDHTPFGQVTYGVDTDPVDRLDVLHGRAANGEWTLSIVDRQRPNSGVLLSWSLGITFAGDTPASIRPSTFAPRKVIAAVAHTPGALGTAWQTDVRLFNGSSVTANVTAIFTHSGDEGWNHFAAVKLSIAPRQVMTLDDVVAATMQTSGVGQLEFLGDTDALVVTSRTFTRANGGTYGQFIPAVSTSESSSIAFVTRIQASSNFRTNIGFAETAGGSGTVRVTLFDGGTGSIVSQQDLAILPFGQLQFPAAGASLMTAELRVVSGDARIVAYSSVIDNGSGDPIYVPAAAPRAGTFAAPVINQPGVNSLWHSDIFVSSSSDSAESFQLTYTDAVTGERIIKQSGVGAHEVLAFADVVASFFGRTGLGSVVAELPANLAATSRTFTATRDGTYGQFIPLSPVGLLSGPRELLHIESSSAFRTNLGAINMGDSDEVIRFTLYDAAGRALASSDRTVGPLRVIQFSVDELTTYVIDGRVEVEVVAGNGHALAWASVVDNATGDPIFVPAQ